MSIASHTNQAYDPNIMMMDDDYDGQGRPEPNVTEAKDPSAAAARVLLQPLVNAAPLGRLQFLVF